MKPVAYLVKDAVPNYLSCLPIPDTFGGWFRLGCKYFYISINVQQFIRRKIA